MNKKPFFAIGHITNDTEPIAHLGGGVSYSALVWRRLGLKGTILNAQAANNLGLETHIITKCPENHPSIKELGKYGIIVHNLPKRDSKYEDKITTFRNIYDELGNRRQFVTEKQEDITYSDLDEFPSIPEGSTVLIAPVIHEVDPDIFSALSKHANLAVTPQGYFRTLDLDGEVKRRPWREIDSLRFAKITILSDEDLTFDSQMDENLLNQIRRSCPITVLTEGAKGLTVFDRTQDLEFHVKPFPLFENEIKDFTGAGDSTASAFIKSCMEYGDPKEAGVFAAFYAALKIKGLGGEGTGLATIPTFEQIKYFIFQNYERYRRFLNENSLSYFSFYPEGQNGYMERR